jgi:hypothetical protein
MLTLRIDEHAVNGVASERVALQDRPVVALTFSRRHNTRVRLARWDPANEASARDLRVLVRVCAWH